MKYFILGLIYIFISSCKGSNNEKKIYYIEPSKAESLINSFERIHSGKSSVEDEKTFLLNFPGSFQEFVDLFGYNERKGIGNLLYKEADAYINLFLRF